MSDREPLKPEHLESLKRYGRPVAIRFGEHRPAEVPDNGLIVVLSGELRTYAVTADGREVTLFFSAAGDLLIPPTASALPASSAPAESTAIARFHQGVIASDLLVMHEAAIIRLAREDPSTSASLTLAAMSAARVAIENLQDMMLRDAEARVASLLLRLESIGASAGDPGIPGRITHEQMAGMVGVARETVSRVLSTLRKLGVIGRAGRRIVIKDRDRLRQIST